MPKVDNWERCHPAGIFSRRLFAYRHRGIVRLNVDAIPDPGASPGLSFLEKSDAGVDASDPSGGRSQLPHTADAGSRG